MTPVNKVTLCPLYDGLLRINDIRPGRKIWGANDAKGCSKQKARDRLVSGTTWYWENTHWALSLHQDMGELRLWRIEVSGMTPDDDMRIKWHYHKEE